MGRLDLYKKDKKKKKNKNEKDEGINISERVNKGEKGEIWVVEDFEEPYYITPDSEDFKRMAKEPDFQRSFAGGGTVIKYFNRGGGVYGYNQGGGVNKHQGQYDIQVKKIKGKGKVL